MDSIDLTCNAIVFLIFMILAILALKASPTGFLAVVVWLVIIVVVVGFIVYMTFGFLEMLFIPVGLMMVQKNRVQLKKILRVSSSAVMYHAVANMKSLIPKKRKR